MLILFSITFITKLSDSKKVEEYDAVYEENERLKQEVNGLNTTVEKIKAIESVEKALSELDDEYYIFDPKNKRYKLNIDIQFKPNESDIDNLSLDQQNQLIKAGNELYNKINNLLKNNKDIDYLLVVEGNTQRSENNWRKDPDTGYKLSYKRALALFNFWKSKGIDFYDLGMNCEIIIAGSGYWGQSRDEKIQQIIEGFLYR